MKLWRVPLAANSSRPQRNPASTSTMHSTISSARSDDTIRRWQATQQAEEVTQEAGDPQARWK